MKSYHIVLLSALATLCALFSFVNSVRDMEIDNNAFILETNNYDLIIAHNDNHVEFNLNYFYGNKAYQIEKIFIF